MFSFFLIRAGHEQYLGGLEGATPPPIVDNYAQDLANRHNVKVLVRELDPNSGTEKEKTFHPIGVDAGHHQAEASQLDKIMAGE